MCKFYTPNQLTVEINGFFDQYKQFNEQFYKMETFCHQVFKIKYITT